MSLWLPQLDGFFRKTQGCPNCGPHKKYPSNSFALNESRNSIHRHNGPNSCLTQAYYTEGFYLLPEHVFVNVPGEVVLFGPFAIHFAVARSNQGFHQLALFELSINFSLESLTYLFTFLVSVLSLCVRSNSTTRKSMS